MGVVSSSRPARRSPLAGPSRIAARGAAVHAHAAGSLGRGAGEAEVHDADLAVFADHDVVGFEVAVNEALLVRGGEAAPGRHEHLQHVLPPARLGLDPVGDGVPFDELHRDEHLVFEGAHVEHDDHVGVRQPRDGLRLAQGSGPPLRLRNARAGLHAQQLHRHLAIELRIVGGVDLPHAAAAHQAEHDETAYRRAASERSNFCGGPRRRHGSA